MNRKSLILLIFISLFWLISTSYWDNFQIIPVWTGVTINTNSGQIISNSLSREDVFNFLWDNVSSKVLSSYEFINLNFTDVKTKSKLYTSLQKLVYLNSIKNLKIKINKNSNFNAYSFYLLSEKIFWIKIIDDETEKEDLLSRKVIKSDLDRVSEKLSKLISDDNIKLLKDTNLKVKLQEKKEIFKDVYNTLLTDHYDSAKIDEIKFVEWAIEWMTNSIWDKFSVYFPPTESKDFYDNLNWEYEWIWCYVEMETPWVLKIVTPISWSPSEKSWLKWWDIVVKVDQKEVTKENSVNEVVSWIKWKAWTEVVLTINRDWKIFEVKVIRENIIIKDVEYKVLPNDTFYIQIRSFWDHVLPDFKKSLEELKTRPNIKKIIIDLRNNGWGYLSAVTDMLSYFVPINEPTAVVKYTWYEETSYSLWYNLVDFTKYKIVILENSWTASASEIMIWTIKDYFKDLVIIWENSYWKGSVQTIRSYTDWSSLKYTIAKWFTWKTKTWIDKIWIKPTIELELNITDFKNWIDNQLEKAKSIN